MAKAKRNESHNKMDRLKPLSLYPFTPEKVLSAFMRVKPKKVTKTTERKTEKKN